MIEIPNTDDPPNSEIFEEEDRMSGTLATISKEFALSSEDLAQILKLPRETIEDWLSEKVPTSGPAQATIASLDELRSELRARMDSREITAWLRTSIPLFDRQAPLELIMKGQLERVRKALFRVRHGLPV